MNREKAELIPFQEGVNVNLFFPGALRRELLDELKRAIAEGVTVLSVTGDEGTGKTMICRMLEQELTGEYICVYLPDNLESFDEVIRILAAEAGGGDTVQLQSTEENISAIIHSLSAKKQRLVVIFDQAERIYLAMLERLRKLLDLINADENLLQLVFAGRNVLLENLDQLAICDFTDTEETHFHLDDLDMSETYAYLNHCARQRSRAKGKSIFTPEASKKIFSVARGNFKKTNIIAAKSIESADIEGSFVVAPKNVNIEDTDFADLRESFLAKLGRRGGWLIPGGVVLLLCVLLIVLFRGGDEDEKTVLVQTEKPVEIKAAVDDMEQASSLKPPEVPAEKNLQNNEVVEKDNKDNFLVFKTVDQEQAGGKVVDQADTATTKTALAQLSNQSELAAPQNDKIQEKFSFSHADGEQVVGNQQEKLLQVTDSGKQEALPGAEIEKPNENTHIQLTQEPPGGGEPNPGSAGNQVIVSQLSVQEKTDSTLIPLHTQVKKSPENDSEKIIKTVGEKAAGVEKAPGDESKEPSPVLAGTKKSVPPQRVSNASSKELFQIARVKLDVPDNSGVVDSKTAPSNDGAFAGSLYDQRMVAGKVLFSQKNEEIQTIQIMALTGGQAEQNLREKLTQQQYRDIAENLYILKGGNGAALYVFYGEYPDKISANQAREHLPLFIRKNDPYVISIREAQNKATLHQ